MVNGQQPEILEERLFIPQNTHPHEYRGLYVFPLAEGQNKVQITGTWVAPEFGSIAMVAMASIVSVIIALHFRKRWGLE
jgi:predicted secreted protein with PEFG-CTERM motif